MTCDNEGKNALHYAYANECTPSLIVLLESADSTLAFARDSHVCTWKDPICYRHISDYVVSIVCLAMEQLLCFLFLKSCNRKPCFPLIGTNATRLCTR